MRSVRTLRNALLLVALALVAARAQVVAPARVFIGHETEIEEFLRTAPIERVEELSLGVTRPSRAWLQAGGPVASAAWKPIRPGTYKGFRESYQAEIAAYEMDKLLELHMVPPAVERTLNGKAGALIMWIDGVRMWRDVPEKPTTPEWKLQMVRMGMFDALIGNVDRNAGNILIDDRWTVYLIDHSRAFVGFTSLPFDIKTFDPSLWARMRALDEPRLQAALGRWVERKAIRAILSRRDKMAKRFKEKQSGSAGSTGSTGSAGSVGTVGSGSLGRRP